MAKTTASGECIFFVCISLILLAAAAADSCGNEPWNKTACCSQGITRPGAKEKLSIDCGYGQSPTTLVWEGSESSIGGLSPERLFLYSFCVNPTSTSLQNASITTLFHDSNLHTLSTEIIEPSISKCSYFGCYGAFHGFYYFTFSEVSCTSAEGTSNKLDSSIAVSSQTVRWITSVQSSEKILMSQPYILYTSNVAGQQGIEKYLWYILLVASALLVGCGCLLGAVIIRHSRKRDSIKSSHWPSQMWTLSGGTKFTEEDTFPTFETLSMNSDHTTYEDVVYSYNCEVHLK